MPPSEKERQKLLLQQEIAQLSGAIARYRQYENSSYHPYRGGYRGRGRGSSWTRGSYSGRGRGGSSRGGSTRGGSSYSLDLRQANRAASASTSAVASASASTSASAIGTPVSGTPGVSASNPTDKEEGEVSDTETQPAPVPENAPAQNWVRGVSRGGNMSLMTKERREQLASRPPQPRPRPPAPHQFEILEPNTESMSDGTPPLRRVVIDNVVYQFEKHGQMLVRVGEVASGPSTSGGTPKGQSVQYGGESYRRTKTGNLMTRKAISARRAEQGKKFCRYYTKTGRCNRALTCPYKHVPDRLAICQHFLRGTCNLGADKCPLSHVPSAHNTASCSYFQATATCKRDAKCPYPHVRVAADAPVCEDFAREGWCDRVAGTCPDLHIWECPEWHAKGMCSRGSRCGLPHILRAEKVKKPVLSKDVAAVLEDEHAFEDQASFIGFPGEVFSDSDDDDDVESDTSVPDDNSIKIDDSAEDNDSDDDENSEDDSNHDEDDDSDDGMDLTDQEDGKPGSDAEDEARVIEEV